MEYVNLKDYIETMESGKRPKGGAVNEGIPSLGGEHITSEGKFNLKSNKLKYVPENYYNELKKGKIQVNDILVVKDGATTGKTAIVTEKFPFEEACINEHLFLIRTKKELKAKYLYYYFLSDLGQHQILKDFRGATIGGISREFININLYIPNIEIQEKIIKILDKSQELIYKKKEQIFNLDELVKSRFVEMFGDPVKNVMQWEKILCKEATLKIGSGATPKGGNSSYKDEGISLIRSMNVYNNNFVENNLAYIDDEQAEKLKNVEVKRNDVLLNITGASVARCCIVPPKYIPARVNQHVSILRCEDTKILPIFLCYQFTNENYQRLLWEIASNSGATREAITKQQIENLEVIIPPIELQNQFADFVTKVDKLKFEMEKSLKELEYNFNSLMQKAFKGELF